MPAAVEWLGLSLYLARLPGTLSSGERQRVALARALLSNPVLLLMDEPLAALDVGAKSQVLTHLVRLREKLQIPTLYVTHALDEVARLADHVVWLEGGKVLGSGPPADILGRMDTSALLGSEAGGLIDATVTRHDDTHRLTELESAWGPLVILRSSDELGAPIRLRIRASDVSVSLERERHSSILNVLEGVVEQLAYEDDGQVLVRVACPTHTSLGLLARVSRRSVEHLSLATGLKVFLRIKGVSVR
jgi:molybdate transport system ATP-binding protein